MSSKLIIMSGPAGSGKSTWALNYKMTNLNVEILSTDDLRQKYFNTPYPDRKSENFIRKTIVSKAIELSSQPNITVIIDSAVVKNKSIMKWWRKLSPYFDRSELIIIDTSLENCLKQNQMRDRHVPEDVIKEMYSYKEPLNDELMDSFDYISVFSNNCTKED